MASSKTIALLGIFSALFGAVGGAASNYYFGEREAVEAERRILRAEAYIDYFTWRDSTTLSEAQNKKLTSIYRVLVFGDSDVVEKMAAGIRAEAKLKYDEEARNKLMAAETNESINVVEKWIDLFQAMRSQYQAEDTLSAQDLKTVLCALPDPCFGGYDVGHLFE